MDRQAGAAQLHQGIGDRNYHHVVGTAWEIVYQLRNEAPEERRGEAGACCGHHRCARFSSLPNSRPPRRGLLLGAYSPESPAFETSDKWGGKPMLLSIIKVLACIILLEALIFIGILLWFFVRDNL